MVIVVHTTGFSTLVLKNSHPSKVVNIILHVPKEAAFILSKSNADQCRYCKVSSVTSKMQTDKQTNSFPVSLYSSRRQLDRCDETKG